MATYTNLSEIASRNISIAYISDIKSSGTSGGTNTTATWQTRTLNTLVDPTSLVTSLSANQFTLSAGSYLVEFQAPGLLVNEFQARLYNVTDSTVEKLGAPSVSGNTVTAQVVSNGVHFLTISASKAFRIEMYSTTARAADGLGRALGQGEETYTQVKITKVK